MPFSRGRINHGTPSKGVALNSRNKACYGVGIRRDCLCRSQGGKRHGYESNELNELIATQIIQHLEKRRKQGSYAPSAAQAVDEIVAMIPQGATVYRCGSMTATGLGLWQKIAELPEVHVIDPYVPGISPEEAFEIRRKGLTAEFMIASSNAITLDGKLVNLDATGNRVAAMCFGPKKVLLVVGMNKVAPDLDSAMARVKHYSLRSTPSA